MLKAAIGGFDGVHLGHQELIKKANLVIIIEKGSSLTPGFDRIEYFNKPFDFLFLDKIKNLTPKEFVDYLLSLNVSSVIVGEDFRFGKNRSGDIGFLEKYFDVDVVSEVKMDGVGVHARVIREMIARGEIKRANRFLGRPYKIKGERIKGQGLGSKELVPTVNIELFKPYSLPKEGVYVTKTNGLDSVSFIGVRSTDLNFSIETHIIDKDIEINGMVEIEFIDFLRENRRFKTLDSLKKAINEDIQNCKRVLNTRN